MTIIKQNQVWLILATLIITSGFVEATDFNITVYGAKADASALNTDAIQKAIDACAATGGDRVIVPSGVFRSAGIVLKDHVTLFLSEGAVLRAPTKLSDYDAHNKAFVSAEGATDVGLAGKGMIDGSGAAFMVKDETYNPKKWAGREWMFSTHFAYKALPRPANVKFTRCRNVTIRDVTLTNATSWTLHCSSCDQLDIEGVIIRNPLHGVNNDGIDINMCRDVRVINCDISTGDDAICLKCNDAKLKRVSRNILVADCRIETECQAFKIGTETLDGFENIVFRNSYIYNRSSDVGERAAAGIAIETVDGAVVNGVTISNIEMTNVRAPIFIRLGNRGKGESASSKKPGALKNVVIENVNARHSLMESSITGIPGYAVENVTLRNISIELEGGGQKDWTSATVPEVEDVYPAPRMFKVRLPAYGFYCRHANGITFTNLQFSNLAPDFRPMLVCEDVGNLTVDGMQAREVAGDEPLVCFKDVHESKITHCAVPLQTKVFLKTTGAASRGIVLADNKMGIGTKVSEIAGGAAQSAVQLKP